MKTTVVLLGTIEEQLHDGTGMVIDPAGVRGGRSVPLRAVDGAYLCLVTGIRLEEGRLVGDINISIGVDTLQSRGNLIGRSVLRELVSIAVPRPS